MKLDPKFATAHDSTAEALHEMAGLACAVRNLVMDHPSFQEGGDDQQALWAACVALVRKAREVEDLHGREFMAARVRGKQG